MRVAALVCVLVLVAACDGDAPRAEPPTSTGRSASSTSPAATPSAGEPPGCANQDEVVAGGERLPGALVADIDGDDADDTVSIALDLDAELGCQAFLVVESAGRTAAIEIWRDGAQGGLPQPSLASTAELGGDAGFEIVVNEASGASTQFVGVYTMIDGSLERITVEDRQPTDLFGFGGSVGHVEAVDCIDGRVVITNAVPAPRRRPGRFEITRYSFRLEGRTLEAVEVTTVTETLDFDEFPEFTAAPFANCR